MRIRNYKLSSLTLSVTFIISIFLLFFIVSVSYKKIQSLNEASKWVFHSQKVQIEIQQLLSGIKDAETGQRGFLLTGDTSFLDPYKGAMERVNDSFSNLKNLTTDNQKQQIHLDSLKNLIDLRFKILNNILENKSELKAPDSLRSALLKGKYVMNNISVMADKILLSEMLLLKDREKDHNNEIAWSPLSFLLIAIFSLVVLIVAFYRMNKGVGKIRKINNQMLITRETFDNAEQSAEISNWYFDIELKRLVYSKNQYKLLGYQTYEFKPTLEKFLEFVHPEDKHIVSEENRKMLTRPSSISYYRIIRKDGAIRHFRSLSKIITDHYGKKIIIGINADITKQYQKDKMLEEKLFDLERSNNELLSFNHVASHDLQEPLRKIQTLISRIREKDFDALTDKGKEYFIRTEIAANRMQKLINDLLTFSRTNKSDTAFELTDLNGILENCKLELGLVIEEKDAIIHSSSLPTLKVIPFQVQQLFINLINNSLKYSRHGITPVVKIEAKLIYDKEMAEFTLTDNKKFHKISFTDNGIGFEQQYSKNIFTLFHRLHDDNTYSGTGIGLTICKKIIENHKGFITAEGIPGTQATFNIFFPV